MNRDQFNSTTSHRTLEDAFLLLDRVQELPPHRRVLAVVLLFRLLQQRLGLDVSELLNKADRIAYDADYRYFPHISVVRAYIDNEIANR